MVMEKVLEVTEEQVTGVVLLEMDVIRVMMAGVTVTEVEVMEGVD